MAQNDDKRKDDELDTETTFADMNIDGFSWYDPSKKKKGSKGNGKIKLSSKEYWSMVKGAFLAMLPVFAIVIVAFLLVWLLSYLWLI